MLASFATALQLVAITHVTAIDVAPREPTARSDVTVLVDGERISAVGAAGRTTIPPGARVIDGRGKWLIPGLWDMHVHTVVPSGQTMLSLYIANGVTGVRDMGGDFATIRRWRDEIARDSLVGPRIVAAGPYLEGHDSPIAHLEVHTPDDARRAVDSFAVLGVDFVKVHSALTREAFFAAAREARAKHLAIAGHLARDVAVTEASDAGQRSLEHLLGFANVCSKTETILFAFVDPLRRAVFGGCALRSQNDLYAHLARNATWVTPTLAASYEFAVLPKHDVPGDSLARFISDSLRTYLAQIFGPPPVLLRPNADAIGKQLYSKRREVVIGLFEAGVPILAGTDSPMRNVPPGFGLHHELTELVRSGLTPGEGLRAATFEPARYFDALDSLGSIAPGKVADLVLLDANPLDRIENARQRHIVAVVTRGRVYDRAAIDALLSDEERLVQSVPSPATRAAPPAWSYPLAASASTPPDKTTPRHVPGSRQSFTAAQALDPFDVADWFPEMHPPMPASVSHGRRPSALACAFCHLPDGAGRPENAELAGLPADYIASQVAAIRAGTRDLPWPSRGSPMAAMHRVAVSATEAEIVEAARYFAGLAPRQRGRVVEATRIPGVRPGAGLYFLAPEAGSELLGQRLIEVSASAERHELHDPSVPYTTYVPLGSIRRGRLLATEGLPPGTPACMSCHGTGLRGSSLAPPLAGRSPSYVLRQLLAFAAGTRADSAAVTMRPVAATLSLDDMIAAAAYVGSIAPQ